MKKYSLILLPFFVLAISSSVMAVNNQTGLQNQQQSQALVTPSGNQIKNQNQVKTQNQGEDSQLQIRTEEQESLNNGQGEGLLNRNQNALENMSEVARQVQQLLQIRTQGGIGEQVRLIAQAQNQAQNQIQEQLNKLDTKGKLARLLTGTDYGAVKNIRQQLEQNLVRIKQLQQLQNQLTNQGDLTVIQEMIEALIAQNTSLQERITNEEQTKSLFGWVFRFFGN